MQQQLFVELSEIVAQRRSEINHKEVAVCPRQFDYVAYDFEHKAYQRVVADDGENSRIRPNEENFRQF